MITAGSLAPYGFMHHRHIMRTTVDLADHLLLRAKQLAASERTTLTAILEDSLRMYLASAPQRAKRKQGKFHLPVADGGKPARGINLEDTSALMEIP
jgi:hypothetical protein